VSDEYGKFHVSDEELRARADDAAPRTVGIHPKVAAASWAGALSVIVVWIVGQFGVDVPAEVASAFTTLIAAFAGYRKGVA
jgi:hypothetical protein